MVEIWGETKFLGRYRLVWVPMNPSSQSKLRGDGLACIIYQHWRLALTPLPDTTIVPDLHWQPTSPSPFSTSFIFVISRSSLPSPPPPPPPPPGLTKSSRGSAHESCWDASSDARGDARGDAWGGIRAVNEQLTDAPLSCLGWRPNGGPEHDE